ncbi:MAG: shikimate dehydrogenase family protein [Rhabdaerophilum sp.]
MLDGSSRLILHLGYPTTSFRAPLIYNPYFESIGLKAAVVPVGVTAEDFAKAFPILCRISNFHGALITMPHKVSVLPMLDEVSEAVRIAGACNAVLRRSDGALVGDMFDGEGFVLAMKARGEVLTGGTALILGCGGVGSAIAAALARHGIAALRLMDRDRAVAERLAERLENAYPALKLTTGSDDPDGAGFIINATPLGMHSGDPMPIDIDRLESDVFVGDVVMTGGKTAFLAAAEARGARIQLGIDMLYEQIPAYLSFFGLPVTNASHLRALSKTT